MAAISAPFIIDQKLRSAGAANHVSNQITNTEDVIIAALRRSVMGHSCMSCKVGRCENHSGWCLRLFLRVRNHSSCLTKQPRHVCQRRAAAVVGKCIPEDNTSLHCQMTLVDRQAPVQHIRQAHKRTPILGWSTTCPAIWVNASKRAGGVRRPNSGEGGIFKIGTIS